MTCRGLSLNVDLIEDVVVMLRETWDRTYCNNAARMRFDSRQSAPKPLAGIFLHPLAKEMTVGGSIS